MRLPQSLRSFAMTEERESFVMTGEDIVRNYNKVHSFLVYIKKIRLKNLGIIESRKLLARDNQSPSLNNIFKWYTYFNVQHTMNLSL